MVTLVPTEVGVMFRRSYSYLRIRPDPEGLRLARQLEAARRWLERRIDRDANRDGKALVRTKASLAMQHDHSARRSEFMICVSHATYEGNPGHVTIFEDAPEWRIAVANSDSE